jgi:hypothetical protein
MSDGATTTADVPGYPMPFAGGPLRRDDGGRTRVRRRKRKHVGEEMIINEWRTRPVSGDTWEVKVGKKWVQGKWRTVNGHRVFFKGAGGMLPAKSKAFAGVKPGIIARIKAKLFGTKKGAGAARRGKRSEGMEDIRDVAAQLMEADVAKSASKNVIELIAVDAAEAPKVQRRLAKLLGDKAEELTPELATALMPSIVKWLEAKGVKVQGVSAAEKALRTAAKE